MSTLHEDLYIFLIILCLVLLRMRNVSDEICIESQNTRFIFQIFLNCAFYEIMWKKNIVQPGRPQMTVWCRRIRCRIPKATNTHSEYVILIAFPQQLWWHKHTSMLSYMYIACPVNVWEIHFERVDEEWAVGSEVVWGNIYYV